MKISDETPIVMLTVGKLREIIQKEILNSTKVKQDYTGKKYAFGLRVV
jgi:hypothetical protein